MEAPATETLENNVESLPEVLPKEEAAPPAENPEGVSASETQSDKVSSDKELSWEKIAAEIAAEDVDEPPTQPEPESTVPEVKETVINSVSEEKVTEPETAEVIPDSTVAPDEVQPPSEPVAEAVAEIAEPLLEEIPLPADEASEAQPTETLPVDEVIEEVDPEEATEETVEITELKPDETPEVEAEEVSYTVIEAEEVETNEIIEEHLAQTKPVSETVVIINPDQSQTEITIEQVDDDDRSDDNSQYSEEIYLVSKENESVDDPEPVKPKVKKQRGRKPIADIPLHVLGRDISKPTEGVSNGGRTMPKPRLGVKVPYRNLTSQIVSKQEIEKEIMERFKLKQEQNATNSGDILFARKLTQRLAKKLIPTEKEKDKKPSEAGCSIEEKPAEIKNNSDLIAILEGEGDDIELTKQKKEEEMKEAIRKSEKEIALQQLKELPGNKKIFKSRNEEERKVPSPQKEVPKVKAPPPTEKKQVEVEPRLKTGMVIKTYTRKRKSEDLEAILPLKKTVVTTTTIKSEDGSSGNVYITKSSRIIKRKVIWDPDEVPSKSPIKSPKSEQVVKAAPAKPVEKKEQVVKAAPAKPLEKKEPVDKPQEKKIASPVKKITSKSPPLKKPKRLTEVDKLLMDEGAVNMLYDVKTNDETSPDKKKKTTKSMISLDRAHRELMSKTDVIKNDLQQNTNKEVQKSLRKKEIVSPSSKKEAKKDTPGAVTRKKSKDSARSSVHSPPSSPPYNAAEASRIIRRHSSSSFSSNDEDDDEDSEERPIKKKSSESPKKKLKKLSDSKPVKETTKNNNNTVSEPKANHVDKTVRQYESFTATKKNKLVSIKLLSMDGKCFLDEQVLTELTACLKEFGKDDECHVVSITSDCSESFCEGLDYRLLVVQEEGARKKKANEMASLVKEFLRCLLTFPKVLVAGIQGDCVGLGVTMLPLFDMVIASDTSTFSAPYSRLGCVPEAGFLLTVPHLGSNGLASELLYTSHVLKADDAFRRGLVTRLCWPEKYQQELKTMLLQVANQSRQCIVATKQQLRQHVLQSTEGALSSVSKVLVEHWTSPECQKNFSK